ncbi:MAG: hypothetical protein DWC10_02420 [Candidatus Poseidoniales archaeon]|nr:MAG: hypothetical protein DWC10_02420 [Candidatus Poseidoniales archaeon]
MVKKSYAFGLPLLSENPFNIRPLESGEAGKLVGRGELFQTLQDYLHLRSARRIMLTGPLGSGRTSLVRCLKPYASAYASIDYLPANAPAQALLEMCFRQMIGGEPPSTRSELVNRLVNEMYAFNNKLPMVVIDVPASDLSVLEVALRDAHSSLERLNALVVLVCDIRERHQLPSTVIESFDRYQLMPFNANDVFALVQQRLASVGVMDSDFSMHDATAILDQCDGYPASVITLLRNAVDSIRMGREDGFPDPYVDTSARLMPRDEAPALHSLMSGNEEVMDVDHPPVANIFSEEDEQAMANEGGTEQDISSIIDASIPWDQRDTNQQAVEDESEVLLPPSLFELDFDALKDAQSNDEPLQPTPFNTPIIDASEANTPKSTSVTGMFGKIAQRGWNTQSQGETREQETAPSRHELVEVSDSAELWMDEASLARKAAEPVPEEASAALIHDEIGLPELPEMHEAEMGEMWEDNEPDFTANSSVGEHVSTDSLNLEKDVQPEIMAVFAEALRLLQGQSNPAPANDLVEFFRRRRVERLGPRESYPLDKHLLGSLNSVDAYVVSVADQRPYSPSDGDMLSHLSIKRSRLSQISNRLLKHGILQARQTGRSRQYSLTQAARAQLVAWGGLAGGDAQ